ncbi:FtsH protease activity modulator HflK [Jeotgalibacillus sp. ET6]|uniref:FtsH protease activity modulator HflK n=1 Tax=Jeotgalibacillus sp. ET6 TaxID=3037260 RepID=UPI0024182545|nr:FtsH protease activity modulator HflK [Jeotgalibacillus sp. ET6]MDG5471039.1 FtsH protease activity modulator HflK [Jeotgalibacillus sp. ET6]
MSVKRITAGLGLITAAILLIIVLFTSWYTVDESEQALVMTFGEANETITESGLKFKMPWPIQQVEVLSKETFSLQFGYEQEDGEIQSFPEETKMITGDENIVLADLVVQWKIVDAKKYLFNAEDPEEVLYDTTAASIRSIIGSSEIDDALTSGKAEIELEVRELLSTLMEKYDMGISVQAVQLQDVELPNEEVRQAFTAVTDARETMNTKENQANKYRNQLINEAEGEKDAIESRAEGEKTARIEQARGDVAIFDKLYAEYQTNPDITRQRLILETLEEVLPDAEVYIMNDDGGTLKYLPLNPLERSQQPAPQEEAESEEGNNE